METNRQRVVVILKPSERMVGTPGYPSLADQLQSRVASGYAAKAKRILSQCDDVILTDENDAWRASIKEVTDLGPKNPGGKSRVEIRFGKPERIQIPDVPVMPSGRNNVRYG